MKRTGKDWLEFIMFTHAAVSPSLADKTSLSDLAHKKTEKWPKSVVFRPPE
jgi:hypothetical protein